MRKVSLFFCLVFVWVQVNAQITSTAYSGIGIGYIPSKGLITNDAMGGIGISNGNTWQLNTANPALLPTNQLNTFDFALTGETRNVSTTSANSTLATGGLKYLALGIPVTDPAKTKKLWTMAVVLRPYSVVNYDVFTFEESPGLATDSVIINRTGTGGLVEASWANGVQITPEFSLGVKASYIFGNITRESVNQVFYPRQQTLIIEGEEIIDTLFTTDYKIAVQERESYSDFVFELGAAYRFKLSDDEFISLGATYEFKSDINAELFSKIERRTAVGNDRLGLPDTLETGIKGSVLIPARVGFGVSYTSVNKFTVGFDYINQDWTKFRSFDRSSQSVQNAHLLALGAEFIPDINAQESYMKRITYRFGLEYDRTPYRVKDEPIDEFGINFGVSLPVSGLSNLNFGFEYGQIGATRNGLIKEEYFKFAIGASFNSNRWKRLPRFN